ncbi:MAG: hypothetical protein QHI38_08190 [Armatimonadota bacterium]|nr:hypothetical protein [Armatimonadota bacterium]
MKARTVIRILAALLVILSVCVQGAAAFTPRVSAQGAQVLINGRTAIRFRTPNAGLTPDQRAAITAERIRNLVNQRVSLLSIYAKSDRRQARVMAGETLICIATAAEARAARMSPLALAGSWAANIRELLSMPAIVLSDRQITVPLGETRRVVVGGAAVGPITAKSDRSDVATVAPAADGRYILVTGQQVGSAVVTVEVEGESESLFVMVKKYAGAIPSSAFAEVTGNPCPASLVSYAAAQAALRSTIVESGASARIESMDGADEPLDQRMTRQVRVRISISGPGYIDRSGICAVEVHNSAMPRDEAKYLFYSNNPERFTKYQELFVGKIVPNESARILYHHQNAMGKRARLMVELVNPRPVPGVYRVFRSAAAPIVDTVLVGYIAGAGFLRNELSNASVIERIPPKSRLVLVSDVLSHMETASGILQVRQLAGEESYIRVAAVPPELDTAQVGSIGPASEFFNPQLSEHVYATPWKTLEAEYVVGKQWAFIPIGKHSIPSHDARRRLDGNYGVTYEIKVKVENPTDQEKKVQVVFDPAAGIASGIFVIDGSFVSAKYAKPPAEIPLATYRLKPGETRHLKILTLPLAGSNYPATLIVRAS